jgi:hypothetical protein
LEKHLPYHPQKTAMAVMLLGSDYFRASNLRAWCFIISYNKQKDFQPDIAILF